MREPDYLLWQAMATCTTPPATRSGLSHTRDLLQSMALSDAKAFLAKHPVTLSDPCCASTSSACPQRPLFRMRVPSLGGSRESTPGTVGMQRNYGTDSATDEVGGLRNNVLADIGGAAPSSCTDACTNEQPHQRVLGSPMLALEMSPEWASLLRDGLERRERRAAARRAERRREAKCERQRQRRGRRRQEREQLRAALMAAAAAAFCAATAAAAAASKAADACG